MAMPSLGTVRPLCEMAGAWLADVAAKGRSALCESGGPAESAARPGMERREAGCMKLRLGIITRHFG